MQLVAELSAEWLKMHTYWRSQHDLVNQALSPVHTEKILKDCLRQDNIGKDHEILSESAKKNTL